MWTHRNEKLLKLVYGKSATWRINGTFGSLQAFHRSLSAGKTQVSLIGRRLTEERRESSELQLVVFQELSERCSDEGMNYIEHSVDVRNFKE